MHSSVLAWGAGGGVFGNKKQNPTKTHDTIKVLINRVYLNHIYDIVQLKI